MTSPLVSVILPIYNGDRFIPGALDCIQRQRTSGEALRLEVIAVDDGSDDARRSAERLAVAHAAGLIDQVVSFPENRGPAAARNAGLRLARGELVTFLDVDDHWPAGHLSRLHRLLAASPDHGFILSDVQCQRRAAPDAGGESSFEDFGRPGFLPLFPAGLFRREAFERVGPLDESLRNGEDLDWFLRAREAGVRYLTTGETVYRYRLHESNVSRDRKAAHHGMLRALHLSVRRRAAAAAGKG